jgi:sugar-phosphatase
MIQIECDAILFDLDGVLIDSTVCITHHWQQWAQKHGLDLANIMQVAHGRRTVETIQLVAPHLPAEEEAKRFAAVEAVDTDGVVAIEGASQLLSLLPSDTWAIVTSGTRDVATARLRHTGLPVPGILVTADDVTNGKPNPEPYLVAAKGLGISPDKCVVIEDAPAGVKAARSAGMQAIAIATTHAHHTLAKANAIAEHLSDIQIEKGSSYRLAIQIDK